MFLPKIISLSAVLFLTGAMGFCVDNSGFLTSQRYRSSPKREHDRRAETHLNLFGLDGATSAVDTFFQTEPYLSAFLTCSLKASAADWVAQSRQEENNLSRNMAFIIYGGIYQGCVQTFIFSVLFPCWFPDPSIQNILTQVAIDLLVLGPMVCMPTVYTMKALFAGEEGTAGIQKYLNHVQNKGILLKYWSIWAPVQTLNFSVVPHHLRVPFVAMISFFWICLLSSVSSSEDSQEAQKVATPSLPEVPQSAVPVPVLSSSFLASHHKLQKQKQQQIHRGLAHITSS